MARAQINVGEVKLPELMLVDVGDGAGVAGGREPGLLSSELLVEVGHVLEVALKREMGLREEREREVCVALNGKRRGLTMAGTNLGRILWLRRSSHLPWKA